MQRTGQSNADAVAENTLRWLARPHPRPFLLWVHFYDPHSPFEPPDGHRFGDGLEDRYDAEVAYADVHVGKLVAQLPPNTVVVITADHGEDLGEHGVYYHGRSLYDADVRVPLIVHAPAIAPRVVDTPVSLADIAPTVLELAGLPRPAGMNGRSLAGDVAPRPLLIELVPDGVILRDLVAVVDGEWKVVWDRAANAWSLYRIAERDATDHAGDEPEVLARMQRLLRETLDRDKATAAR